MICQVNHIFLSSKLFLLLICFISCPQLVGAQRPAKACKNIEKEVSTAHSYRCICQPNGEVLKVSDPAQCKSIQGKECNYQANLCEIEGVKDMTARCSNPRKCKLTRKEIGFKLMDSESCLWNLRTVCEARKPRKK